VPVAVQQQPGHGLEQRVLQILATAGLSQQRPVRPPRPTCSGVCRARLTSRASASRRISACAPRRSRPRHRSSSCPPAVSLGRGGPEDPPPPPTPLGRAWRTAACWLSSTAFGG
jgi:hypothetical protein